MADPFVAEIRIFPFNFAPKGWAWCDGQLMPLSQNTALFSLLGTTYGGNGKSNFALPDLDGRAPIAQGDGQGLTERYIGEADGEETVTLLQSEMPFHNHSMNVSADPASEREPPNQNFAQGVCVNYWDTQNPNVTLNPQALTIQGGSLPHNNMQPYLTMNFCIAMQGVFPARG